MQRDTQRLASKSYDLLIIGGGVHGCTAAREAAIRGLKVALIEQNDFASGNSANSLKTIHGGLRYLQNGHISRMLQSIAERRAMLRLAPHLVHPLGCLLPTSGIGMKSKFVMWAAMLLNDIISSHRNRKLPSPQQKIPRSKILSRKKTLHLVPGIDPNGITGSALWYDAQAYSTERLIMEFWLDAVAHGAEVANYVEATKFLVEDGEIVATKAVDKITGEEFEIKAKCVINCAGPKIVSLLKNSDIANESDWFQPSTALNLIIDKPLLKQHAAGVRHSFQWQDDAGKSHWGSRVLFMAPWRGKAIIGTRHLPLENPEDRQVTEAKILEFLKIINEAYPEIEIERKDVIHWHWGILPMEGKNRFSGDADLKRHSQIIDHASAGIANLLTVIGVKFTTARAIAEDAVQQAASKLNYSLPKIDSTRTPLPGGREFHIYMHQEQIQNELPLIPDATAERLAHLYGNNSARIIRYKEHLNLLSGSILQAEIIYAIRDEMALHLTDVILRRTDIGSAGKPADELVDAVAAIMAKELKWDEARKRQEISDLSDFYCVNDSISR